MGINNKNMLVAGDFYEQSINLIPDVTFEESKIEQSIARYKGFTEQISAINPSFTFDYSRHPALTIMDGENVLAIAVSPELRHSHLALMPVLLLSSIQHLLIRKRLTMLQSHCL